LGHIDEAELSGRFARHRDRCRRTEVDNGIGIDTMTGYALSGMRFKAVNLAPFGGNVI